MSSDKKELGKKSQGNEDIIAQFLLRPFSKYLTKIFMLLKFSPNMVSFTGVLVAFIACYYFYLGDRTSLIIGAIITYFSILIGTSDGEVARLSGKASPFGDFFDSSTDISKFWLLFFFLSLGVYNATGDVKTMIIGQFAAGAFVVGHYIRAYSYRVTTVKTYELRFTKQHVFYFTVFVFFLMIFAALFDLVKPFLILMAIVYPLTWLKKMHTVYKFVKTNNVK
tara:strand:+ start:2440 stop:3108 length:669 start_codon:yes stop_codon:yes gene_type:complete